MTSAGVPLPTMTASAGFSIRPIGTGSYAIDRLDRTLAIVNSHGSIDWLLRSVTADGPLITSLYKETHLSYTLGLRMHMAFQIPESMPEEITFRSDHDIVEFRCIGRTADGRFVSDTTATLVLSDDGARYEWHFGTLLTNVTEAPITLPWIEFNNVYPSNAGRSILYEEHKEYRSTILVDREGTVWDLPHQHLMHYSEKINTLEFEPGTLAGFFDESSGNPVVIVTDATLLPDWGICDRYYDLHCGARSSRAIQGGETLRFAYHVKYLDAEESATLTSSAVRLPVTDEDLARYDCPRLEPGVNTFTEHVRIDRYDDASGFPQAPPEKVWDRVVGRTHPGSLRLTSDGGEVVWAAMPPMQVSPGTAVTVAASVRTEGVAGPGVSLRVRYSTWVWEPAPHTEWVTTLQSEPVADAPDWTEVAVPALFVPDDHLDYSIDLEVVLDGPGVAWLTDLDLRVDPA